jgi:propionyl-CoA carboxylase alpha chain
MFKKILIANRGEIACRVIASARRMGITTVAVFSDADRDARHSRLADEAVWIGASPSADSYLDIDRIVDVCRKSGAEAVHPGYGFLSENAAFVRRLEQEGIVFVGPGLRAIEAMGDKIESKKLAMRAGVTTIPGVTESIDDAGLAVRFANDIGYPVMLKATAGGGGKGMRVVHDDKECRVAFARARSEARSSFGDDRVFIEKYIEQPRHIEIQVFGDHHGNHVHLNERECSIQRRHQKVIEEAPSPFIDAATRRAMGEQAVALAREVGYHSAGTVEFIVDRERKFYFLEMNTRLQVEHPVTEMITGIDLVEWMIRVAAGEPIPWSQEQIAMSGWAVEARIYAEDPVRGFLPSVGRLTHYREPSAMAGIRVDSGVYEGSEIPIYYDPMIAKLIGHGRDRDEAITRLASALSAYHVRGLHTNIPFVRSVLDHERFRAGDLSTDFIADEFPDGFRPRSPTSAERAGQIVIAGYVHWRYMTRAARVDGQLPGAARKLGCDWVVRAGREEFPLRIVDMNGAFSVEFGGSEYRLDTNWKIGEPILTADIDGRPWTVQVERRGVRYRIDVGGVEETIWVLAPRVAELLRFMPDKAPPDLSHFLLSPMPGLLVSLSVAENQRVEAGEEIAVVEAMKMENILRAEQDSTVARIHARPGDTLEVDQPIVEFARA